MTAKYWLSYPVCALASAISLSTQAEQTTRPEDNTLDSIVIFGDSYRSTGTKSELQPMEAPMSFERVDAQELEQQQVSSVDDSLRYTSGTSPENRGGAITIFDQYTLRGFSTYNNYYNGLPLQYNTTGNLAPQVDMFATDGVEILKGPASVLYGASSPGGMINQLAKQPQYERATEIQLTTGSNDLLEAAVDTTGHLTDSLDYRLIALGKKRDGQQEGTEEERWVVAPSATWYIGDNTSLNLNAYYQDDPKAIPSTPLPGEGTLTEAPYGFLEPDTFVGDINWANVDKTVTMLGYKFNHDFSNNLTFLQNFRYTIAELEQKNSYFTALTGTDLSRNFYFTDEAQDSLVVDNQLSYDFNTGPISHSLLGGLEYHKLDLDWKYGDTAGSSSNTLDLTDIDNNQIDPASLDFNTFTQTIDVEERQLGIYLQDELTLANTTVVAGIRHDEYDASANSDDTHQDNVSLRFAAIHHFNNGLAPYASYSESFEPLAGDDFEGNPLKPETANQYEAGVKLDRGNNFEFTAAAFQITKQNIVSIDPSANIRQTGEVQSRGVELGARIKPLERLNVRANLTVLDAEITENEGVNEGNTPHLVAEQTANIWVDLAVTQAFSVSSGVRYVGEMQSGNDNADTVPAYTLVDAATRYNFGEHYSLSATVSNLLNETYLSCGWGEFGSPYPSCWYGSPRNIELSFIARF